VPDSIVVLASPSFIQIMYIGDSAHLPSAYDDSQLRSSSDLPNDDPEESSASAHLSFVENDRFASSWVVNPGM
jgi:hypothetical protein